MSDKPGDGWIVPFSAFGLIMGAIFSLSGACPWWCLVVGPVLGFAAGAAIRLSCAGAWSIEMRRVLCVLGWHRLVAESQTTEAGRFPGTERWTYECAACGTRTTATEREERKMGIRL